MAIDAEKLAELTNWLIAGAPPQQDFDATVAAYCRGLAEAGIDFGTVEIYRIAINPLVLGKMISWTPKRGVIGVAFTHEQMRAPYFVGSLIEHVYLTRRTIRYRIGATPEWDVHPMAARLIERGYTEYFMTSLFAMHEPNAGLGVGTKRPEGFRDEEIVALLHVATPLARVVEAQTQHENTETLLATYLGGESGARVLNGQITRGNAEIIPAVILFADLTGFTALSNACQTAEVIATLNRFFEALEGPIERYGGVVLKLIGDGLLAIFPTPDDPTAAERAALGAVSAVDDARRALAGSGIDFRAALHVGDIHYGNIGGANRLDFTAIGPAVNLAARMLGAASDAGAATVCSPEFAALAPDRAQALGPFDFKGFDAPRQVLVIY